MKSHRLIQAGEEKGLTLRRCINRARKFIDQNGLCLLVFDVKSSRSYNPEVFINKLEELRDDLNSNFSHYMPENQLRSPHVPKESGFILILGDMGVAGINSVDAVSEIRKYHEENYPDFPVYWSVARDGYDREALDQI